MDTELPKGVKPTLAVGFKAFMSFLFFSLRVNTAAIFHKLFRRRNDSDDEAEYMEPLISFKADPQKVPVFNVTVIMKTAPKTEFVITSSHKETAQVSSDHNGYLRIEDLPRDEYSIRLKDALD